MAIGNREGLQMTTPPKQFRIGVLLDTTNSSKYVYEFIEWAQSQPNLRVTHLILHPTGRQVSTTTFKTLAGRVFRSFSKNGVYGTISKVLFQIIIKVEGTLLRKIALYKNHLTRFDLSSLVTNRITITPIVSKSGFVYRFNEEDIGKIRALNLDILIRGGGGILRGDILNAARLGVISFHHADNRFNRGGPAGFWEVYLRKDTTGFTIQRLTEELDGGIVLMRGNFPTRHYFLLNQAALYEKSNHYLKLLIEKIAKIGELPTALPALPYSEKLFRTPDAYDSVLYLIRNFANKTRNVVESMLGISIRWHVAFVRSDWRQSVFWRGIEIKNPPFHFLADPFVISREGKDYCFVEDYDFLSNRGSIAVYELGKNGTTRIGTALAERYHLSFPYIFECQGALFMCPETCENNDIRIYRCIEFPLRWKLERIAMQNVSAVDTMIFERNGKWWMFTNIDPIQSGDHCSELFIFCSASPIDGTWVPHSLNPIIVDASCARNAGLVMDGDRLFRVSQGQGFNAYGERTLINEVIELTEDTYLESCISIITPTFRDGIAGTHHLHSNGKLTVFDFAGRSVLRK